MLITAVLSDVCPFCYKFAPLGPREPSEIREKNILSGKGEEGGGLGRGGYCMFDAGSTGREGDVLSEPPPLPCCVCVGGGGAGVRRAEGRVQGGEGRVQGVVNGRHLVSSALSTDLSDREA